MTFSEFAQILFSIIGGEKYSFTIELLKAGLDASGEEIIDSIRSDASGKSRIRKYLSGDNEITELAPEIVNSFSQNLFVDYIIETIDESNYPELCKKFEASPYNITIDKDDVPQRLAEIYEDILKLAAKGKNASYNSLVNKNYAKLISKMKNVITELIEIGRKIAEFRKTGVADEVRYSKLKDSLHNEFKQLITLTNKLSKSSEVNDSQTVENIVDSVMSLEENCFILSRNEYMIISIKNYHIHRLDELLSQLLKDY